MRLFNSANISLASASTKLFPVKDNGAGYRAAWGKVRANLVEAGCFIIGWPEGVQPPNKGQKGIQELKYDALYTLLIALRDERIIISHAYGPTLDGQFIYAYLYTQLIRTLQQ